MDSSGSPWRLAIVLTLRAGLFATLALSACQHSEPADKVNATSEQVLISRIADRIENLKAAFPQLAEFAADEHCDPERLIIRYEYKTHRAKHRGGWTSGVPNPDEDGIWFYIDIHDPSSTAQIHTQPVVTRYQYADKEVMFLILEGAKTTKLSGMIVQILRDHGVMVADARGQRAPRPSN